MAHEAAVQSVGRGLRILGSFGPERRELTLSEIAASLDVHPSTASRLAATLTALGFLERPGDSGAFRLGPEMVRLGLLAAGGDGIVESARGAMEALAAETGETVVLSVPSGDETIDVAQVDTRYLVGGKSWIGRRLPLHASSDGKVFLAFGASALPAGRLEALSERTITDRGRLDRALAEVRERGWAAAVGECEEGLNGVAAPVFSAGGRCVAALSVSGPAYRLPAERLPELGALCVDAACGVSLRLGWSGENTTDGGGDG